MPKVPLQLFKVECRGNGGFLTAFDVAARSSDEAILQARKSVQAAQEQEPSVPDPFDEVDLEVRVGTHEGSNSSAIVFGSWSRLYD